MITERGISNGISMLIFASIVAGITQQMYSGFASSSNIWGCYIMLVIVLVLVVLSIFILKSLKEIPIIYKTRKGSTVISFTNPSKSSREWFRLFLLWLSFLFLSFLAKLIVQFQPANVKLVAFLLIELQPILISMHKILDS